MASPFKLERKEASFFPTPPYFPTEKLVSSVLYRAESLAQWGYRADTHIVELCKRLRGANASLSEGYFLPHFRLAEKRYTQMSGRVHYRNNARYLYGKKYRVGRETLGAINWHGRNIAVRSSSVTSILNWYIYIAGGLVSCHVHIRLICTYSL